jgi:hypothetical protein
MKNIPKTLMYGKDLNHLIDHERWIFVIQTNWIIIIYKIYCPFQGIDERKLVS